ncbi:phosphomannomutase [Rheinheimera sp. MM224]|uniref:phosphomannomutase n=1 Tax=Rheinheimera sp. MM224 TaxID=3019969 RepID=UPI0021F8D507|nr:phosphomannomutase [Rheinheimera sp. MM224]CAI3806093.1 Phosphomannomutase/phosphoglucomutase [Rheinheimera sp. MM224]
MWPVSCFKTYDIRGTVPEQLNEELAWRIGRALCQVLSAKTVVIGHDIRLSSPALSAALAKGLTEGGANVIDIGLCGTEQVYFSVFNLNADAGICITASHNPANYNGMKLVGKDAEPLNAQDELQQIKHLVASADFANSGSSHGTHQYQQTLPAYLQHLLTYIQVSRLKPLKVVMNAGHGGAGLVVNALAPLLPLQIIPLQFEPDGTFPTGVPNPLLVENRAVTSQAVLEHQADFGVAWDGDFDRCFFFDEQGQFIDGYYVVSLLAQALLNANPQQKIVHDPRLYWATQQSVAQSGGTAILSQTGHVYMKEKMRAENALYGGEISAHHYFRDFAYCDNGTIPWLLVAQLLSQQSVPLSSMVKQLQQQFPCSDEINFKVKDASAVMQHIQQHYQAELLTINLLDGLDLIFKDWRLSLRSSNTEPLLRLNIETRADRALLQQKISEVSALITTFDQK